MLKAVIECFFADDEDCIWLMKSHNLRALLEKIKSRFKDCPLDSKDYKCLGEESGLECIRLLEELIQWIDTLDERPKQIPAEVERVEDIIRQY